MDLRGRDVYMIKKIFVHKSHIALQCGGSYRIVFVEIEGDDMPKTQSLLSMQSYQLCIHALGRRSSSQAKQGLPSISQDLMVAAIVAATDAEAMSEVGYM
jgi:hypothetical protein